MTGVGGRPLRRGRRARDRRRRRSAGRAAGPAAAPEFGAGASLRVTAGPQAEWFGDELYGGGYTVSGGIQPHGTAAARSGASPARRASCSPKAVPLGAVQVPPDGQPIILFVEHQTTGGYPKPANVISADFWRLGQLRPRDQVALRARYNRRRAGAAARAGGVAICRYEDRPELRHGRTGGRGARSGADGVHHVRQHRLRRTCRRRRKPWSVRHGWRWSAASASARTRAIRTARISDASKSP